MNQYKALDDCMVGSSISFPLRLLCFTWFTIIPVVAACVVFVLVVLLSLLMKEKSSPIHMIVLFSLCRYCKFMTRSHTHPNWEHLHFIFYYRVSYTMAYY